MQSLSKVLKLHIESCVEGFQFVNFALHVSLVYLYIFISIASPVRIGAHEHTTRMVLLL